MKIFRLAFMSVLGAVAFASAANAEILSSGPVFIFGQTTAVCHLTNISSYTARGVTLQIIAHDTGAGTNNVVATGACGNMVGNAYCNAVANSLGSFAYSCKAIIADDSSSLRGNLDIRINTQETKITAPLH